MKLGKLLAVNANAQEERVYPAAYREQIQSEKTAVPIEPGTEILTARVTAAWELVPE
jgi:hypothetical protein